MGQPPERSRFRLEQRGVEARDDRERRPGRRGRAGKAARSQSCPLYTHDAADDGEAQQDRASSIRTEVDQPR